MGRLNFDVFFPVHRFVGDTAFYISEIVTCFGYGHHEAVRGIKKAEVFHFGFLIKLEGTTS